MADSPPRATKRRGPKSYIPEKSKKERKREHDLMYARTRIYLGKNTHTWHRLKKAEGIRSDPALAKLLLDSYLKIHSHTANIIEHPPPDVEYTGRSRKISKRSTPKSVPRTSKQNSSPVEMSENSAEMSTDQESYIKKHSDAADIAELPASADKYTCRRSSRISKYSTPKPVPGTSKENSSPVEMSENSSEMSTDQERSLSPKHAAPESGQPTESPSHRSDKPDVQKVTQTGVSDIHIKSEPCDSGFEIAENAEYNSDTTVPNVPEGCSQKDIETNPLPIHLYRNTCCPLSNAESIQTQPEIVKMDTQGSSDIGDVNKQRSSVTPPDFGNVNTQQSSVPQQDFGNVNTKEISVTQPDVPSMNTHQSFQTQPDITSMNTYPTQLTQLNSANSITQPCLQTQLDVTNRQTQESSQINKMEASAETTQQNLKYLLSYLNNANRLTQQISPAQLDSVNKNREQGVPSVLPSSPNSQSFVAPSNQSTSATLEVDKLVSASTHKCSTSDSDKSNHLSSIGKNVWYFPTQMPVSFNNNITKTSCPIKRYLVVPCTKSSSISISNCQTSHILTSQPNVSLTSASNKMLNIASHSKQTNSPIPPKKASKKTKQLLTTPPIANNSSKHSSVQDQFIPANKATKKKSRSHLNMTKNNAQHGLPTQPMVATDSTQLSSPIQLNNASGSQQMLPILLNNASGSQQMLPLQLNNASGSQQMLPIQLNNTSGSQQILPIQLNNASGSQQILPLQLNNTSGSQQMLPIQLNNASGSQQMLPIQLNNASNSQQMLPVQLNNASGSQQILPVQLNNASGSQQMLPIQLNDASGSQQMLPIQLNNASGSQQMLPIQLNNANSSQQMLPVQQNNANSLQQMLPLQQNNASTNIHQSYASFLYVAPHGEQFCFVPSSVNSNSASETDMKTEVSTKECSPMHSSGKKEDNNGSSKHLTSDGKLLCSNVETDEIMMTCKSDLSTTQQKGQLSSVDRHQGDTNCENSTQSSNTGVYGIKEERNIQLNENPEENKREDIDIRLMDVKDFQREVDDECVDSDKNSPSSEQPLFSDSDTQSVAMEDMSVNEISSAKLNSYTYCVNIKMECDGYDYT